MHYARPAKGVKMTFKERKQLRTEYYLKYEYKKKLVECSACSGSGWYDSLDAHGNNVRCSACDGCGKVREWANGLNVVSGCLISILVY